MGFSRKGYWSELPFPPPGNLPHPGIKPTSPALQADSLTSGPPSCVKSARAGRSKLTAGPSALSWRSLCVLRSAPPCPSSQGLTTPCPGSYPALHPGVTPSAQGDCSASSNAMVTLISKQRLERGPMTSCLSLETPNMKI